MPLPRAETTPPVTNTYFGGRVLTGFQGSRAPGSPFRGGLEQRIETVERALRVAPIESDERRTGDRESHLRAIGGSGVQRQLGVDAVARQVEGDPFERLHCVHEQLAPRLRTAQETGTA